MTRVVRLAGIASLIAIAGCGTDSATAPTLAEQPPASSVPSYKIAYTSSDPAAVTIVQSGLPSRNVYSEPGTIVGPVAQYPSWSPTGTRLAFTVLSSSVQALKVWDSQTESVSTVYSLIPKSQCDSRSCRIVEQPFSPTWSGDGSKLAFVASGVIRIVTFDGTAPIGVSSPPVSLVDNTLVFTPGGTGLAFLNGRSILSIPLSGGAAFTTVASVPGGDNFLGFQWSPDAKTIAITTTGKTYLWDVATATTKTVDLASFFPPSWSPDGSRVAIASAGTSLIYNFEIFLVSRDAAALKRVTSGAQFFHPIAWLADGVTVVTIGSQGGGQAGGLALFNTEGGGAYIVEAKGANGFAVSLK